MKSSGRLLAAPFVLLVLAGLARAADSARHVVLEVGANRTEVDEGSATSEKHGAANDAFVQKPAAGKADEIVVKGGASLAKVLDEAFGKECARKMDASFVVADRDYAEQARLTFAWGIVTEVDLPSVEAGAKDPALMTLKIAPQFPRRSFQKGAVAKPAAPPAWQRSSFKLAIDGLDASMKAVQKVGELHVTQTPGTSAPIQCGAAAVSELGFSLPAADAAALAAWKDARNGSLDYVAADGTSVVKLRLTGLKKKSQAPDGALVRVTASVDAAAFTRK